MRIFRRIGAVLAVSLVATCGDEIPARSAPTVPLTPQPLSTPQEATISGADPGAVPTASPTAAVAAPDAPPAPTPPAATGTARAVVRDFAGAPVAGARVVARPPRPDAFQHWPGLEAPSAVAGWRSLPPSWDLDPRAATQTSDDGRASLAALAPGLWTIAVDAPGRVRRAVSCVVAADAAANAAVADVEIRAEAGHPLEGRVLTERGAPVAGAFVVAEYPGIAPEGRCADAMRDFATARADADGRYRFDALPATVVLVSCGPPGAWSSHVWAVRVPSVAALDLRMTTHGPVEGHVRAEPQGKPVAGAQIVLSLETWHTARVTAHATTDAEGHYSLPIWPGDGVMSISVDAPGFCPAPRVIAARQPPFRLYEDRPTVLNLALRPDADEYAAVRGVVRGPDGPVAGAGVFLTARGGEPWMSRSVTTDAAGKFRIFDVPARRIVVVASDAPGLYQPGMQGLFGDDGSSAEPDARWWIAADAPRPVDLDIVLAHGGRISGRVVDADGRPVAGAEVFSGGRESMSAADGAFVLEGFGEPDEVMVFARKKDAALEGQTAKFRAGVGADVAGIEVRVAPKARAERERRVVVTGRASVADPSAPMRDARVVCDGVWTPLDPTGAFRVEVAVRITEKEQSLNVVVPGWGEREVKVAVPAVGAVADTGDVEVPRAGTIRGRVADANGSLAGVPIGIERTRESFGIACGFDEDPSPPIFAVTDAEGAFEAASVSVGDYEVHASSPGYVEDDASVSVAEDGAVADCSIRLAREAFLRGRVVRGDGQPVAGASLVTTGIKGADGWGPGGSEYGRTDSDGRFSLRVREGDSYSVEVSPARDYGDEDDEDTDDGQGGQFLPTKSGLHVAGDDPIEIVVGEGATISGRIVDVDGHAVAGASVTAKPAARRYEGDHDARTAADGTFALTALGDDPYQLTIVSGLQEPAIQPDVAPGSTGVEIKLAVATVIAGVLLGEDGKPAPKRTLVATRMQRDDDRADARIEAVSDAEGRFRFVGAGAAPCRIELVRGKRWERMGGRWPLAGGAGVAPGAKDVVLRIPTAAETTIAGRVVDDADKPFLDFLVCIPTGPGVTVMHSGDSASAEFEYAGLRLDAPCEIVAEFAGLRWKLAVPAGTSDLVLTAGADGLHKVEFGGREHAKLTVAARIRGATNEFRSPAETRLVHAATGVVVAVPKPDLSRAHLEVSVPDAPVGPYRVEGRDDPDGPWRACRPGTDRGEAVLVWDD